VADPERVRSAPQFDVIVLARRGSKSIQDKNLQNIGGLSLTERAIQAGHELGARCVYLSTDYDVSKLSFSVPFTYIERPASLSDDHASSWEAIEAVTDLIPDLTWLLLLQPTSPFRPRSHGERFLRKARWSEEILNQEVVPISRIPSKYGWITDDEFLPFVASTIQRSNRQTTPYAYRVSGRYYLFHRSLIKRLTQRRDISIAPIITPCQTTLDIDIPEDLHTAERFERKFNSLYT